MVNFYTKPLHENSPWLMLPSQYQPEEHHIITKHSRFFLNVSTNQVHRFELPKNDHEKTVCGFSADWLILLDGQNSSLTLLNPFTGHQVNNLPQLPPNGAVHKAILSSDPLCNPRDYKVLAIFGEKRNLICYEDGNQEWTVLQGYGNQYDDVLASTDKELLAVNELGRLVLCDLDCRFSLEYNERALPSFFNGNKVYLVSLEGLEFILLSFSGTSYVFGHQSYDDNLRRFEVYYYVEKKWHYITDLGERTIFLGHNHSVAVCDAPGYRRNCIYFTGDEEGEIDNSGVFSLKDGEAERLQWFMPGTTAARKLVIYNK
ncbi:uncharacterized protein LOC133745073 [Rosa rugosa]|uniref:uncharacterized protein LOC133745073 n=1 Tax=Rosa rugosa TaxID=74645 RepID=UPI002B40A967|nr:uncharacterized protein LOC133745073 [Rosa rugosa]